MFRDDLLRGLAVVAPRGSRAGARPGAPAAGLTDVDDQSPLDRPARRPRRTTTGPGPSDRRPLRLARLHLRTGAYGLARAELETLAGAGALDDEALLDLAEVRWRTDDLTGAGEAAAAYIAGGHIALIALVVAAEATSALGRPGEARRLAGRALELVDGAIDPIFAGMPRSDVWPARRVERAVLAAIPRPAPAGRPIAASGGVRGRCRPQRRRPRWPRRALRRPAAPAPVARPRRPRSPGVRARRRRPRPSPSRCR